jgi:hypothetical protein
MAPNTSINNNAGGVVINMVHGSTTMWANYRIAAFIHGLVIFNTSFHSID